MIPGGKNALKWNVSLIYAVEKINKIKNIYIINIYEKLIFLLLLSFFPWMQAVYSLIIKTFTVYLLSANNLPRWDLNPISVALKYMREPIRFFANSI